ncbi:organic cation transporter protein-like [Actinia tenebrosa]|uniref:Organic cation transporter protein-like n=1 Tax=Actinia tenebrosa TaxID=6105 RepID=A0A6P8IEQ0_ACTTE|nr:organic cation transporter protein-like [Actinia tenebrosa]
MSKDQEMDDHFDAKQDKVYDDVFNLIPSFGRYQKIVYFTTSFLNFLLGPQFGLLVFAMSSPRFRCTTPNITCEVNKCCQNCTSYAFDEGQFTSIVTEWNLICDRAHIAATIQSCFFAGMLIGSIIGGLVSDAFGRRTCMFGSCVLLVVVGVASSFADCLSLLGLLRFFVGFFLASFMLSAYIYAIELLGPNRRAMGGQINHVFWSPGYCVTALWAYFIRDWRYLVLGTTLPPILFFLAWKVFPESVRWLIAHNRLDDAQKTLMKCGGKDGKPLNKEDVRNIVEEIRRDQVEREQKTEAKKYSVLDLFRTPKLRKRSIILAVNWFVVALVHFGFYLYVNALAGSLYINYAIMNSIYVPHLFLCWFLMQRFGRRLPYTFYMIGTGVSSLLILAVPKEYPIAVTVLALIGKTMITTEFSNVYLFTAELYPTLVRNSGIGLGSMSARVGGIIAPYIVMLSQLPGLSLTLPTTIFGVSAMVAGILSLWLPETLNVKLPQTIEEVEATKEIFKVPGCCGTSKSFEPETISLEPSKDA